MLSKNEPVFICKEGWCIGLGHKEGSLRESGAIVWNTLKLGGIEKRAIEAKGGKLDEGVGALKSGGWNPLTNYAVFYWKSNKKSFFEYHIFVYSYVDFLDWEKLLRQYQFFKKVSFTSFLHI